METIYLITDRYEHAEFYEIYGKGIYTDEASARADLKKEYADFVKIGPDDCHTFRLTKHVLSDEDLATLKEYYKEYCDANNNHKGYEFVYREDYTSFMEKIMNDPLTEELFCADGCSDAEYIYSKCEENNEDCTDPVSFTKYFDEIWQD